MPNSAPHSHRFVYLAAPLAHPSPTIQNDRIELASLAAAMLMERGLVVFSPLSHCYRIKQHFTREPDHDFWMRQDLRILHACDELFVLPLDGWRESKGVAMEIDYFTSHKRPISIIQSLPVGFSNRIGSVTELEAAQNNWSLWK